MEPLTKPPGQAVDNSTQLAPRAGLSSGSMKPAPDDEFAEYVPLEAWRAENRRVNLTADVPVNLPQVDAGPSIRFPGTDWPTAAVPPRQRGRRVQALQRNGGLYKPRSPL
jgi:hypothetical protein